MFGFLSPVAEGDWRPWAVRVALASVLAGALTYLPYRVLDGPAAQRLDEMRRELSSARAQIEQLGTDNEDLRREVRALKEDPRAIEDIARSDLGMVFPGDLVVRMEGPR